MKRDTHCDLKPIGVMSDGLTGFAVYDTFMDCGEWYCIAGVVGEQPKKYKLYDGVRRESMYFKFRGRRLYLDEFMRT